MIAAAAIILPQILDGQRPPELGVQVEVSKPPAFPDVKISAAQPVDSMPDSQPPKKDSSPTVSVTDSKSTGAVPSKRAQDISLVPTNNAQDASKQDAPKQQVTKTSPNVVDAKPAPKLAGRWTVQIATFANEENAKRLVEKLKKANYSAYSITTSSLNKVYVGPEFERSASEKSLADIKKQFNLKGFVTKFSEN